jgi:hypothetical protein
MANIHLDYYIELSDSELNPSIPRSLMLASKLLIEMIPEDAEVCDIESRTISLKKLNTSTFHELLNYCDCKGIPEQEKKFFDRIAGDREKMHDLLTISDFLMIERLVERLCESAAKRIQSMNATEIRHYLFLPDDLDDSEKDKIKRESEWCLYL